MEIHNIVQEVVIKTIPKKKKCKEAKWLSEEALQMAKKRREVKGKGNLYLSDSLQLHGLVAHKALLSVGFPSQEYWSGFPFPSAGYLPDSGI